MSAKASSEIKVPSLGESVQSATIARWLKAVGDGVEQDEPLVELETDKVTLEVNAPMSGVLTEIRSPEGETVNVGDIIGALKEGQGAPALKLAPAPSAHEAPAPAAPSSGSIPSPAALKIATESNINLASIQGSGKDGRITKGDVLQAPSSPSTSAPQPHSVEGLERRVKMTRLRQRIAERLKDAQNTAAILTTFNEVDMTNIMAMRDQMKDLFEKKHGVKLGFMSYFVKSALVALHEIPAVNASIEGDEIVYKNYYNIGVAVGTDQGLVVPVVRNADQLSFAGVEQEIARLGKKAKDGKLAMEDLQGGTFTISNGGTYGSLMSTPILNPPQSGILGMHKIQKRPMVVGNSIEIRPMMYLALSYDHRIIDGKEAVTFLVRIKECLENPERILLSI